LANSESAVLPI